MIKNKAEALDRANELVDWFKRDLAYTAPELQNGKWERFKAMMEEFVEEIFA